MDDIKNSKIGIFAVTPEGASRAFRDLSLACYRTFGDYINPEIILHMQNMEDHVKNFGQKDRWTILVQDGINVLLESGCDIIWMPANSSHLVAGDIDFGGARFVNMVDNATAYLRQDKRKKLLLGTDMSISDKLYLKDKNVCAHCVIPDEAQRQEITNIVIKELILGKISKASRQYILNLVKDYAENEAVEEVFFACTELPCFFTADDFPVTVNDSISVSIVHLMEEIKAYETHTKTLRKAV